MTELKAYAKLNLTLDILCKRSDGYHDMRMIMQSISLADTLTIEQHEGAELVLHADLPDRPCDKSNIVAKAADAFFRETGLAPLGMNVGMENHIPVCAGMAGGSSDGAAMLRYLRDRLAPDLSWEELKRIGALVGSDVPFCILCGTAITEEKGQILFPINHAPQTFYVICKPDASLSTKDMYEQLDREGIPPINDTKKIVTAIRNQNISLIAANLYNVFESPAIQRVPEIAKIKQQLKQYGALGAQMTGSGSAVFGIFDSFEKAIEACDKLHEKYPDTFFATTSDFDTAD